LKINVKLPEVVGKGYGTFWKYKGRYRVCKGSRASKKSKTTALNTITRMMGHPEANTLVVRKTFRTIKDSCFTELKWAINRLSVTAWWEVKESPLEMTYTPTGQKIYFRGLDDPLKITSITVEVGHLCWLWIEEAYEITDEDDFDMLDESIRGNVPDGLFKQTTLTLNPWNEKHWIKRRFFDRENEKVLAMTVDYRCNEFLDDDDRELFEDMRARNPRRYKVAGLGEWGIVDGLIYENWHEAREEPFDPQEIAKRKGVVSAFGLDFGYTADPSALFCGLVDRAARVIYVFDEFYEKALTNTQIAAKIKNMGYAKERIIADSAEPKSIEELRQLGLHRVAGAQKGKDSVVHGIQRLQNYKIIIHPTCVNFLTEIGNYTWAKDKFGNGTNTPIDDFNHLMDAMRYALEGVMKQGAMLGESSDTLAKGSYWRK
jgi:phage terminase large subunit